MEQKTPLIKIGDFFFKYRNLLFPMILLGVFLLQPPAHEYGGSHAAERIKDWIAVAIVSAGLGLRAAVIGFRYIKRGGLNKKVYAENLVTDGFFAVCRNPLYVGNLLIYFGVLLMHGAPVVILVGMLFFLFVYTAIVAAEEFFLRTHFGEAYAAYCHDVPRWRMHWAKLHGATEGMKFNFLRVLAKDYTAIANAVVSILGLELWEEYNTHRVTGESVQWPLFLAVLLFFIGWLTCVRIAKKRGMLSA
jgi:protein-S-isoprenylcysteine O-methyltransferase Ste14